MLYWSKKTSLWVALALSAATFTSVPATAGTHSPATDESVEDEKPKKESDKAEKESAKEEKAEKESEDVLEAALKKSFSDEQLARIEKLKEPEKEALSKVALQLKEKKENTSAKDWREDLPKEAELSEKELAEAKKFIEKEYQADPENYELRQMSELLSEEEDRILAKKADEKKQKDAVDDAWAGLSSLTKTTTENLTKLGTTLQEGWNKLSEGEKTAATLGGAVALNTVVPGAGSLLLSGLGTPSKTGSATPAESPASKPSSSSNASSGSHGGSSSSTASVPSTETPASTTASAASSSGSETPATSSTPVTTSKPTPASTPSSSSSSTATSTPTESNSGTTTSNNGITSTPKAQTTPPTSTATTSIPSISSTPKSETPPATTASSTPASQPPAENPVSTASTPSQQLPTFSPQSMNGILEKSKHFPTASVSNLSTGKFMGHEGKYGSAGGNSTSASSSSSPYSTAIGKSGSDDVFAENKSVSEATTSRLNDKRPEGSQSAQSGSPSTSPQPVNNSREKGNADTSASAVATASGTDSGGRESNNDYSSGSAGSSFAQNDSSKKYSSPKDNSDWNYRSEDRGVMDGPVSRGNQLQWDESAQTSANVSNAGVERVKEVLGESNSYSINADYGPGSSEESYSDFARRLSEEYGGRGLADNEAAESALEKPGSSAKRAGGGAGEAGEDESFVSLELGYNVEDVLSEVKKTIQSNGKPKKPNASQVMRSQFAYVNGSSKSDLTAFKESAIKPRF